MQETTTIPNKVYKDLISQLEKLNERLNFILIGHINSSVSKAIQIFPNISHCNSLNDLELNQLMYHTDIHLSVNDSILYYAYGSKVFDAFLYKKPIIFITKKTRFQKKLFMVQL